MFGKLAPNSTYSTRELLKYVPVGAIFVPSLRKTGTNLLHPRPPPIVERVREADSFDGDTESGDDESESSGEGSRW